MMFRCGEIYKDMSKEHGMYWGYSIILNDFGGFWEYLINRRCPGKNSFPGQWRSKEMGICLFILFPKLMLFN